MVFCDSTGLTRCAFPLVAGQVATLENKRPADEVEVPWMGGYLEDLDSSGSCKFKCAHTHMIYGVYIYIPYICMYLDIYIYVCVCAFIYIYIYVYVISQAHMYIFTWKVDAE